MTPTHPVGPEQLERAFALAGEQVADGTVPFVVLAVATADGIVRAEAFEGPRAPGVGLDAICLLASITKPVVATSIVQLVAEGQVALDDGIDRYVPEFAARSKPPVTLWHLLTHTSGLPDYDVGELLQTQPTRAELVRRIATSDLRFEPGSRYEYGSSGFELLATVVERVRGEPLETALRRTILAPLDMADTTFAPHGEDLLRVAPITSASASASAEHDPESGWLPDAVTLDQARYFTGLALGGAGLFATAGDLVRFGRAMLRGGELDGERILPRAYVELMTREQPAADRVAAGPLRTGHYSLGWGKPDPRISPASATAFGHGGATCTRLWVDPTHDLVVVYLSGVTGVSHRPIDAVLATVYAALGNG